MIANQYDTYKIQTDNLIRELFQEIKETVEEIYKNGPAVFVGGAIGGIFDSSENLVKLFICGNDREKEYYLRHCKVISKKNNVQELMKRKDSQRSGYYHLLTNKIWNDYHNYDLIYDITKISKDDMIDQIDAIMK